LGLAHAVEEHEGLGDCGRIDGRGLLDLADEPLGRTRRRRARSALEGRGAASFLFTWGWEGAAPSGRFQPCLFIQRDTVPLSTPAASAITCCGSQVVSISLRTTATTRAGCGCFGCGRRTTPSRGGMRRSTRGDW
jgi:hypothetical protein